MKRCGYCHQMLALSEFNKNRTSKDGHQNRCRSCQIAANRDWAERRSEVRRAALKRRELRHPGRYRKGPREQVRCHEAVARAIKAGNLTKPSECSKCGASDSPIQAHHPSYYEPLNVIWLCARCHGRLHAHQELEVIAA